MEPDEFDAYVRWLESLSRTDGPVPAPIVIRFATRWPFRLEDHSLPGLLAVRYERWLHAPWMESLYEL